jgi:tetratricopeptide (TPR) repeat protein
VNRSTTGSTCSVYRDRGRDRRRWLPEHELGGAEALAEEALTRFRAIDDVQEVAGTLALLGQLAQQRGDFARARGLLEEALALRRKRPSAWGVPWTTMMLGEVAADEGNSARAAALLEESLRLHVANGDHYGIGVCLLDLGKLAADGMRPGVAARLLGASEALREVGGLALEPKERSKYERCVSRARADLGAAAFDAAWQAGRALPLAQAITEARAVATELAG